VEEVTSYDSKLSQAILLQGLNLGEERLDPLDVFRRQRHFYPPVINDRPSIRVHGMRGTHVNRVEPLSPLILH
jgi:hypothetical protein